MVRIYQSVVAVRYLVARLLFAGLSPGGEHLHVAFHLHVVHVRRPCLLRHRTRGRHRRVFRIGIGQRRRPFLIRGIGIHRIGIHLVSQGARGYLVQPSTFIRQIHGVFNVRCHRDAQTASIGRDRGIPVPQQDGRPVTQLAHLYRVVFHAGGHADGCRAHVRFFAGLHRNQDGRRRRGRLFLRHKAPGFVGRGDPPLRKLQVGMDGDGDTRCSLFKILLQVLFVNAEYRRIAGSALIVAAGCRNEERADDVEGQK